MNQIADALILVLNCGSSSIKFAVFDASLPVIPRKPLWNGKVQGIGEERPDFGETGTAPYRINLNAEHPFRDALEHILEQVFHRLNGRELCGIAHRVVHGGSKYFSPVRIDADVLADLKSFIPLAPLHQPVTVQAIEHLLRQHPEIPQIACFDTGFHHSIPKLEQVLPLPYEAWQRGVRRYGFHGLSYEFMLTTLAEQYPQTARGRTIVAHLGNGASLCAMLNLESVATTMGFSALDGLMMGTRTGAVDPGAVLYLMSADKLSLDQVNDVLFRRSGLLGISGVSAEPRIIRKHESDPGEAGERARLALDLYVRRIVREIGALVAVLGGLDLLIFTAGVGEHNDFIRDRVCRDLEYLGVKIDVQANAINSRVISCADSRVVVGVEPTNEEWVAARHVRRLLRLPFHRPDSWKKAMYSRILVPLDSSETSHHAMEHAADLAKTNGAMVVLLHVIEELRLSSGYEPPKVYIDEVFPGFLSRGQAMLDQAATRLRQDGIAVETALIVSKGERVSDLIVEQVETTRCDVVVIGTHGRRGLDRVLIGSDAEQVARLAPVPVLLVRQSHPATANPPALREQ